MDKFKIVDNFECGVKWHGCAICSYFVTCIFYHILGWDTRGCVYDSIHDTWGYVDVVYDTLGTVYNSNAVRL